MKNYTNFSNQSINPFRNQCFAAPTWLVCGETESQRVRLENAFERNPGFYCTQALILAPMLNHLEGVIDH